MQFIYIISSQDSGFNKNKYIYIYPKPTHVSELTPDLLAILRILELFFLSFGSGNICRS